MTDRTDARLTATTPDEPVSVLIIGAGQAGAQTAISLRQDGYAGSINIIGDEEHPPYQRPPLSKKYLLDLASAEDIHVRPSHFYSKHDIQLTTGVSVIAINREQREIQLSNQTILKYGALVIATGSAPRPLGKGDGIVRYLRSLKDVDLLREQLKSGTRLVIIGGGYVGLELAAVASALECDVTVLEGAPQVLGRVTGPEIASYFRDLHARHGVTIKTSAVVQDVMADGDAPAIVICQDGSQYSADVVVGAIGILPNVELAEAAGLDCNNGIVVDEDARTSDPHIWAAGDCTRYYNAMFNRHVRLESVHNANEQARAASASITRTNRPRPQVPWFWSDQYDVKLQTAGLYQEHDQTLLWGSPERSCFAVYYLRNGRLIAVDAVNAPAHMAFGRKRIPSADAFSASEIPA